MIFFCAEISKVTVEKKADITNKKMIYEIRGQIFFASVQDFVSKFDVNDEAETIIIDFSRSKIWDTSAVEAVDKVVLKYHHQGIAVHVQGLDLESSLLLDKLATSKSKIS